MEFPDAVKVPDPQTQNGMLLRAFKRGEVLTVAESLSRYGVYALSQRCGELKRMGWPILSERYKTAGGAVVARYSLKA
jgi:hypothetical protein